MAQISIIVPVYNSATFLERCINSILSQSFSDFELLLVNDGSTDKSGEICQKYSILDNRIRYFEQSNSGASKARNYGVDLATSPWITFIDSDDYVLKNYLNDLYSEAIRSNSDLVVSGCRYSSNGNDRQRIYPNVTIDKKDMRDFFCKYKVHDSGCVWGKLYRSDLLKGHIFFNENIIYSEDIFFNVQYVLRINKVSLISATNYFYNMHIGSLCSYTYSFENEYAAFKLAQKLNKEIKSKYKIIDALRLNKYLQRTINSLYHGGANKISRLKYLSRLKFTREEVKFNSTNFKEAIYHTLISYKIWPLVDILTARNLKKNPIMFKLK